MLVQLATEEIPWLSVSFLREKWVLWDLKKSWTSINFVQYHLNGADDVLKYEKWTRAVDAENRFIAMGRPGYTEQLKKLAAETEFFFIGPELPDISSSQVRAALYEEDLQSLEKLLHHSVTSWCLNHSPYRRCKRKLQPSGTWRSNYHPGLWDRGKDFENVGKFTKLPRYQKNLTGISIRMSGDIRRWILCPCTSVAVGRAAGLQDRRWQNVPTYLRKMVPSKTSTVYASFTIHQKKKHGTAKLPSMFRWWILMNIFRFSVGSEAKRVAVRCVFAIGVVCWANFAQPQLATYHSVLA